MSFKENAFDWLEEVIAPALDRIYATPRDRDLLERGLHERTIVGNFFCKANALLEEKQRTNPELANLVMDIEYNRNFEGQKLIFGKCPPCKSRNCLIKRENLDAVESYPDLIIHQRRTNEHNQVVIEFKKEGSPGVDSRKDHAKLEYFTCQRAYEGHEKENYRYRAGYYIELSDTEWSVQVFEDAKLKGTKRRQEGRWL